MNEIPAVKDREFISTRKAADMLGVAVSTIQLWTDDGLLNAWVTKGGHRRISLDSINEQLLKQNLSKSSSANSCKKNQKLTILIVEDDKTQMELYRQQFQARELDINLIEAQNGYEGLIKTGQHQPAIIITDLMMADTNGFQMLSALKNTVELKNTLIVVISALSLDEVNHKGGLPDDIIFFSKPVSFDNLENLILKQMLKR